MDYKEKALELHKKYKGKIATQIKTPVERVEDYALVYTPGVAEVSKAIAQDKSLVNQYTNRGNLVAIVTDGSAVLGLGNIGPESAYPVMEGKALLFKKLGDVDAVSICLNTQDPQEIIKIVKSMEPTFGGINLEDISAPRCFEIERALIEQMNIPIFHDDQHGTAIVVLAGLINALKLVNKKFEDIKVVINGSGAAGIAIALLLLEYGVKNILVLDSKGIINKDRDDLNWIKKEIVQKTNIENIFGDLSKACEGSDVFIGVSQPGILTPEMIKTMNQDPIIFAMANPIPEIMPDEAKAAGAKIIATGRSDFFNQVNNAVAFPGLFRAIFDLGIKDITNEIKIKTAEAVASVVADELSGDNIIPKLGDERVMERIKEYLK